MTENRVSAALSEADVEADFVTERLDPIMRERCRNDPTALAEWDEIMHTCGDLDEDGPENGKTSNAQ